MQLLQVILFTLLCVCEGEELDIMRPTLNIHNEFQKLQAMVEGLTEQLNALKSEFAEQKSLMQQITGECRRFSRLKVPMFHCSNTPDFLQVQKICTDLWGIFFV